MEIMISSYKIEKYGLSRNIFSMYIHTYLLLIIVSSLSVGYIFFNSINNLLLIWKKHFFHLNELKFLDQTMD